MKKFIFYFILILISTLSSAQNWETKSLLKEIEGQWKLDENRNVVYSRIIEAESLSRDEIYRRAHNYFSYHYGGGRSAIQTQDLDLGRIAGNGMFEKVYVRGSGDLRVHAWHTAIVDVKKGKARVVLILTEYERVFDGNTNDILSNERRVSLIKHQYPVNRNGYEKNIMGKSFAGTHARAIEALDLIERAIKEGVTRSELDNENW